VVEEEVTMERINVVAKRTNTNNTKVDSNSNQTSIIRVNIATRDNNILPSNQFQLVG